MSLAKLKKKIEEQKGGRIPKPNPTQETVGNVRKTTPVVLKHAVKPEHEKAVEATTDAIHKEVEKEPTQEVKPTGLRKIVPLKKTPTTTEAPKMAPRPPKLTPSQVEALLKGGEMALAEPLPKGYTVVSRHEEDKLMAIKAEHIKRQVCSLDYETNGDPDDDNPQDPQDHSLVSAQTAYEIGQAFLFPIGFDNYGANWDKEWFVENFLKPVLEHPDILVIAHNIKFEHQISLLHGIDMFPKTAKNKIVDTMLMVKALALPENTEPAGETGYEVVVGLKPATKALLADDKGMVHGLLHVDDIKSFRDTVGKEEWEVPTGEIHQKGKNKGLPKMKKMSRFRTFNELPVDKHTIDYGCSDSDWALGLYLKLLPLCEAEGIMEVLYELDIPFMMALGEYEMAGWHVSRERLEALGEIANKALYGDPEASTEEGRAGLESLLYEALIELTSEIAETNDDGEVIVPAGDYGMGTWRGDDVLLCIKTAKPFNWGSVQHKQWLFYHVLKMDTRGIERSKTTGLPSTGADTIDRLIEAYEGDSKFMKTLKEKGKYDKIKGTYVDGMLPFCRQDTDKIHTNMNLVSTWRLSSKKPNLQNIPRADNDPMGIRGVFIAPTYDPNGDYSKQNIWTKPVSIITEQKLSGLTWYVNSDKGRVVAV